MTETDDIDEISHLIADLREEDDHFLYSVCLVLGSPHRSDYYPLYVYLNQEIDIKNGLLPIFDMWKHVNYNFPEIMPKTVKFILEYGKNKKFWRRYQNRMRYNDFEHGEPIYPRWYLQLQAADRLSELGGRAIKPLISALKSNDNSLKTGVLFTLGLMRNSESVQPIIESFSGETFEVDEDLNIGEYLLSLPLQETPIVRGDYSGAVFALRGIYEGDLPLLEAALRHPDHKIGCGVAVTLRHLLSRYEPRVLDILDKSLHDPEPSVRYRSVIAFFGTRHARLILECLHDENTEIRKKVLKIIRGPVREYQSRKENISDSRYPSSYPSSVYHHPGKRSQFLQADEYRIMWNLLLDEDDEIKQITLDILLDIDSLKIKSNEVDITCLTDLLGHSNPRIRLRAIQLLGRMPENPFSDLILLRLYDEDSDVIVTAIDSLGNDLSPEISDVIIPFTGHQEKKVRYAAANTLASLGETRIIHNLLNAMDNEDTLLIWIHFPPDVKYNRDLISKIIILIGKRATIISKERHGYPKQHEIQWSCFKSFLQKFDDDLVIHQLFTEFQHEIQEIPRSVMGMYLYEYKEKACREIIETIKKSDEEPCDACRELLVHFGIADQRPLTEAVRSSDRRIFFKALLEVEQYHDSRRREQEMHKDD